MEPNKETVKRFKTAFAEAASEAGLSPEQIRAEIHLFNEMAVWKLQEAVANKMNPYAGRWVSSREGSVHDCRHS